MIEKYWNEMYPEFKTGERCFSLPGFPELLMSPDFERTNIIGPTKKNVMSSYLLCYFHNLRNERSSNVKIEALESITHSKKFWDFQKHNNSETFSFIQKALPFFLENNKKHVHISIEVEGAIVASSIMGISESCGFLFNTSVIPNFRKRGFSLDILHSAQAYIKLPVFYWTKYPWLTQGADEVRQYSLCL